MTLPLPRTHALMDTSASVGGRGRNDGLHRPGCASAKEGRSSYCAGRAVSTRGAPKAIARFREGESPSYCAGSAVSTGRALQAMVRFREGGSLKLRHRQRLVLFLCLPGGQYAAAPPKGDGRLVMRVPTLGVKSASTSLRGPFPALSDKRSQPCWRGPSQVPLAPRRRRRASRRRVVLVSLTLMSPGAVL